MSAAKETCQWTHNPRDGYWDSECGLVWEFTTGTPETNGVCRCPRCARTVMSGSSNPARLECFRHAATLQSIAADVLFKPTDGGLGEHLTELHNRGNDLE